MTDPIKSIGHKMIIISWLLLIALLTFIFSLVLEPDQSYISRQTATGQHEVVIPQSSGRHYLITGQINNYPVTFLLDTGATDVVIPEKVARKAGLKRGIPLQARTANGSITVYGTRLKTVAIGDITMHNVRASINPHMQGEEILLGMSALKRLELIQKNDQLILRQ